MLVCTCGEIDNKSDFDFDFDFDFEKTMTGQKDEVRSQDESNSHLHIELCVYDGQPQDTTACVSMVNTGTGRRDGVNMSVESSHG